MLRKTMYLTIALYFICALFFIGNVLANKPKSFISNMYNQNDQTVLSGYVGSLAIVRGNAEFYLTDGELTLFDFGWDKPSAMVFDGEVRFVFTPSDKAETYQLRKFTNKEKLDENCESITMFFTIPFDNLPDTSSFVRSAVDSDTWHKMTSTCKDVFEHGGIDLRDELLKDLVSDGPGTFFYADFKISGIGHLGFRENPYLDDYFRLYKIIRSAGIETVDVLSGYSPDNDLPSQRGVMDFDITHYDINSKIEGDGDMMVNCRIHFTPLRSGRRYFHFVWYYKNRILSATDSDSNVVEIIFNKDEDYDFGLVFDKTPDVGQNYYIDIEYECDALENLWGIYYTKSLAYWYPHSIIRDQATYKLVYNYPKKYEMVSCGKMVDIKEEKGRNISTWTVDKPVDYISFNIGEFNKREVTVENLPPVEVYLAKFIPHADLARLLGYFGMSSARDMLGMVASDVTNSLAFYTSILGPCPFETIKVAEMLSGGGQGSPGLIHLAWDTFQSEDMEGYDEQLRAYGVAHQWWGHIVDCESYRDVWIIEGLADYCGLWFYQMSVKDKKAFNNMLKYSREYIINGSGIGSIGSKAGPVVMGYRLESSKSDDYSNLVYRKGAYIFHMIRYLLHDYKTGSDDTFAYFLKDIIVKFKDKPITTKSLQQLLEGYVGQDMNWFFDQWVYGVDIPEYHFSYSAEKTSDGKYKVTCEIKQKNVPAGFKMIVPITVLFEGGRYVHQQIMIDKPEDVIQLPILPLEPERVIFNTYDAVLCKVKY